MSPKCLASKADALLTTLGYFPVHSTFSCTTLLPDITASQTVMHLNIKEALEFFRQENLEKIKVYKYSCIDIILSPSTIFDSMLPLLNF